jgi:hypothetical protein
MIREFTKSGEFDENKNPYAGLEMLLRIPFFIIMDLFIIIQIIDFIK